MIRDNDIYRIAIVRVSDGMADEMMKHGIVAAENGDEHFINIDDIDDKDVYDDLPGGIRELIDEAEQKAIQFLLVIT